MPVLDVRIFLHMLSVQLPRSLFLAEKYFHSQYAGYLRAVLLYCSNRIVKHATTSPIKCYF